MSLITYIRIDIFSLSPFNLNIASSISFVNSNVYESYLSFVLQNSQLAPALHFIAHLAILKLKLLYSITFQTASDEPIAYTARG